MTASVRSIHFYSFVGVLMALTLACLVTLTLPATAHATTTYYVSVVGSDSVGVGTLAAPFATVQRAVNVAGAGGGGVVSVGVGVFSGEVTMTAGDSGVSLAGAGASLTTLRGRGHSSVIVLDHVGASTTISGFTITGGGGGAQGAIDCIGSSPFISRNVIIGNSVTNGGGIYCLDSTPTITSNSIIGNSASIYGGGIDCYNCLMTIMGNTIMGNSAGDDGGGINCVLSSSPPVITGNTVSDNSATYNGGGIFCSASSAMVSDNKITGNRAGNRAGGVYLAESSATLRDDLIMSNISSDTGGGIYSDASTPTITNTVLVGNSAGNGGGAIYSNFSTPTITNDTVTGNGGGYVGGGIKCDAHSSPTITNCILWHNGSDLSGCSATYSDVSVGGGGIGDVSVDPIFTDAPDGDYHLAPGSSCIDAATSTAAPATDKDGIARPWGAGVDMGAYEYYVATYHTTASLAGPSSVKLKKSLTLSGGVSPTVASPYAAPGTVTITKTRLVGKKWKNAGTVKLALSGGIFAYSFKPTAKGKWQFVAAYSGGVVGPTTYLSSKSGIKGVTVR